MPDVDYQAMDEAQLEKELGRINAERDRLRGQADHVTKMLDAKVTERRVTEQFGKLSPHQQDALVRVGKLSMQAKAKPIADQAAAPE